MGTNAERSPPSPLPNPADRRRLQELRDILATLRLDGQNVLHSVVGVLRTLLDCEQSVAYGLSVDATRCRLDFCIGQGLPVSAPSLFASYVEARPLDWSLYDPASPEPNQRNVVLDRQESMARAGHRRGSLVADVYPKLGLAHSDTLRVLVCSGPALLAWVGGFRQEPFGAREREALKALIPDLKRRLTLDHSMKAAGLHWAGLVAALEQVGSPAFVLDCRGSVQHANTPGAALLRIDGARTRLRLQNAVRGSAPGDLHLRRLSAEGVPVHYLAVLRGGRDSARMQALAEAAAAYWGLTPRQTEVLVHLARGASNREIGATLRCAPSTTEAHITSILRRAGTDSRASLLARLIRFSA